MNTPPPGGFRNFDAPLVHKICELYKLFSAYLKTFPKQERYSLGKKIEETILEILEFMLSASYLPKFKKNEILRKASDKTDLLKYLFRLAYEIKCLNMKKYILLEEKVIETGKMIGGWIKSN